MQVALSPEAEALVEAKIRESGGTLTAEDVVNDAVLGLLPVDWERLDALADEAERSYAEHGGREVDAAFIAELRTRVAASEPAHG